MPAPISEEMMKMLLPPAAHDQAERCAHDMQRFVFLSKQGGEQELHDAFMKVTVPTLTDAQGNNRLNRLRVVNNLFPAQFGVLKDKVPAGILDHNVQSGMDQAAATALAEQVWKETLNGFKTAWKMSANSCGGQVPAR